MGAHLQRYPSTALHCTPHFPTVNAPNVVIGSLSPLKAQVGAVGRSGGKRGGEWGPGGRRRGRLARVARLAKKDVLYLYSSQARNAQGPGAPGRLGGARQRLRGGHVVLDTGRPTGSPIDDLVPAARRVGKAIESVIEGKRDAIQLTLAVLLAEGHVLIEDVPGVGKTMLAKALARAIDGTVRRVQFTPDLLPSDITGVSAYNQERRDFEFKPGPVFANIVLGDEINRASPKTQSALLEAMEERQVTVDGTTYSLQEPFMVIATQNPVEMEGTYPLPEAQRDRFTARISLGYPPPAAEREMLDTHGGASPLDQLRPVARASDVQELVVAVRRVLVSDQVKDYIISLANATRTSPELRLGASPRAALHLLRASRAWAALDGRDYVIPDDVQRLARPVLAHRLLPTAEAIVERHLPEQVVDRIVAQLPLPRR